MSHELTQTLKDLYTERRLEAAANRWKEVPHWVFAMSTDNYAVRIAFHQLLKTAGLRHVRFHDLRHPFASLLLQQGESPVYVKDQLGHSSIQITLDQYGHLIPGGNKQTVDRLDQPVKQTPSEADPAPQAQPHKWMLGL